MKVTGRDGRTAELAVDVQANGLGRRHTYIYVGVADFKLDHHDLVIANGPEAGQHLFVLALRAGDADRLRSGDVLRLKRDSLNFDALLESSDSLNAMVRHAESGTVRIRELTDSRICVDIDYKNSVIDVDGTIDAALKNAH